MTEDAVKEQKRNERKRIFPTGNVIRGGTYHRDPKIEPNSKCPCGSGEKYKYCCGGN